LNYFISVYIIIIVIVCIQFGLYYYYCNCLNTIFIITTNKYIIIFQKLVLINFDFKNSYVAHPIPEDGHIIITLAIDPLKKLLIPYSL
jgi:hypothetical protein